MAITRTLLLVLAIATETMPMKRQGKGLSFRCDDPGCDGGKSAAGNANRSDGHLLHMQTTFSYNDNPKNALHSHKIHCEPSLEKSMSPSCLQKSLRTLRGEKHVHGKARSSFKTRSLLSTTLPLAVWRKAPRRFPFLFLHDVCFVSSQPTGSQSGRRDIGLCDSCSSLAE